MVCNCSLTENISSLDVDLTCLHTSFGISRGYPNVTNGIMKKLKILLLETHIKIETWIFQSFRPFRA